MSLWTPGGEHPVDREPASPNADEPVEDDPLAGLTPEERERAMAMAAEMDDVRRQLASVPAAVVVANHAMGLYELAAIHLSSDPPNFREGQLAIDAMSALVDGLQGRLGDNEPTLADALRQLKMAYVQLRGASDDESPADPQSPE
jgi:hypothetical protein